MITLLLTVIIAFRNPVADAPQANVAARCGNAMLAAQLADAMTTREIMERPGGYERDPLARPFVHSNLSEFGAAIVTNVAARALFHRAPRVMCGIGVAEVPFVVNNLEVLKNWNR